MSDYRRDSTVLLAAPRQLFDELFDKYDGSKDDQLEFFSEGLPSHQNLVRPLRSFGMSFVGTSDERYRVAIWWASFEPLTIAGGSSRLMLLPGMPRNRAELDSGNIGAIKPLLTLYAGKRSAYGQEWGKKYYLQRSADFPFGDGFSYYAYEHLCPLVSEMFLRFAELTSNFAFYVEEVSQAA